MIINLLGENGEIQMPFLSLEEGKNYEIAVRAFGAITKSTLTHPALVKVNYDGIRLLEGPDPYTLMMFICGRSGFNQHFENPVFFPLRTSQLHYTTLKLQTREDAIFDDVFAQVEIRKVYFKK